MKRNTSLPRIFTTFAVFTVLTSHLLAQGKLAVTSISRTPSGTLTVTAKNTATVPFTGYATAFAPQSSTTLDSGFWRTVEATFSTPEGPVGGNTTTATITLPDRQPKCFYRVIGILGTADDTDGESPLSPALRTAH